MKEIAKQKPKYHPFQEVKISNLVDMQELLDDVDRCMRNMIGKTYRIEHLSEQNGRTVYEINGFGFFEEELEDAS